MVQIILLIPYSNILMNFDLIIIILINNMIQKEIPHRLKCNKQKCESNEHESKRIVESSENSSYWKAICRWLFKEWYHFF